MGGASRSASAAAVEAWEALFRAQSSLFREFSASEVWHGRSTREYDVLYQLVRAGARGMRQRDLTDRLIISQPSLSRMIERLVQEGLIDRCPDPNDGRGALLALTEAGRELQRRIGAGHASDIARVMRERLTDEELMMLKSLAERLVPPVDPPALPAAGGDA